VFKQTISDKANSIFGALKTGTSFAAASMFQHGLESISARSPLASRFISKVQSHVQATKDLQSLRNTQASEYLRKSPDKKFEESVKADKPKASSDRIHSDMVAILTKIRGMVDTQDKEIVKQSDIYKKYGKYFEDFTKSLANKPDKNSSTASQSEAPKREQLAQRNSAHDPVLDDIETNTKNTAEAIDALKSESKTGPAKSFKESVSAVEADLIKNIFNESVVENIANKTKNLFSKKTSISTTENNPISTFTANSENASTSVSKIINRNNLTQNNPVSNFAGPDDRINIKPVNLTSVADPDSRININPLDRVTDPDATVKLKPASLSDVADPDATVKLKPASLSDVADPDATVKLNPKMSSVADPDATVKLKPASLSDVADPDATVKLKPASATTALPAKNATLEQIEKNTKETVDAIKSTKSSSNQAQQSGPATIKGAIDSTGANIITKLFDEDTIDKITKKTKSFFSSKKKNSEEASEENTEEKPASDIVAELKTVNENLLKLDKSSEEKSEESKSKTQKEAKPEAKEEKTDPTAEKKSGSSLFDMAKDKLMSKGLNAAKGLIGKYLPGAAGRALTTVATSAMPAAASGAASGASSFLSGAGSLLSKGVGAAMRLANPFTKVAAAGAAGYALGNKVINPLINKGLTAATGKDTTLGGWIYDKMHPEEAEAAKTEQSKMPKASIAPVNPKQSERVKKLEEKKSNINAEKEAKKQQPIIVNNTTNTSSGGQSSPTLIVDSAIRNKDSTFERVQMQNYWSRSV